VSSSAWLLLLNTGNPILLNNYVSVMVRIAQNSCRVNVFSLHDTRRRTFALASPSLCWRIVGNSFTTE